MKNSLRNGFQHVCLKILSLFCLPLGVILGDGVPTLCVASEYEQESEGGRLFSPTALVLWEDTRVFQQPGTRFGVIDRLSATTPITLKSRRGNWYQVSYEKPKGSVRRGYVYRERLAHLYAVHDVNRDGKPEHLLIQELFRKDPGHRTARAALYSSNRQLLGTLVFQLPSSLLNDPVSASFKPRTSTGLPTTVHVFQLHMEPEACGVAGGETLLVWNGKTLTAPVQAFSVSEAGVFHVEASLTFPNDPGGQKNQIQVTETHKTFEEKRQDYVTTSVEKTVYRWTGEKFVKQELAVKQSPKVTD